VSNIQFGGGDMANNGYDGGERADPWRFGDRDSTPMDATHENGLYFLCITDYAPAPHNNVFIHHHRKVVMDTDNNRYDDGPWSSVWDPLARRAVADGSRYVSMIWLDGSSWGSDWRGNEFVSYTPGGFQRGAVFADKYLPGEAYVFAIERGDDGYTLEASGRFYHGGVTTYRASRSRLDRPSIWHFDQAAYPDYFLFGDPHINFYEGSAEFDDLKMYLPVIPF
jgi:hypothetical protein